MIDQNCKKDENKLKCDKFQTLITLIACNGNPCIFLNVNSNKSGDWLCREIHQCKPKIENFKKLSLTNVKHTTPNKSTSYQIVDSTQNRQKPQKQTQSTKYSVRNQN